MIARLLPAVTLEDGTRFVDLDAHCTSCGKRLCEIVYDPHRVWRRGQIVCLDCGQTHVSHPNPAHQITVKGPYHAGTFLAVCSCKSLWTTPGTRARAEAQGEEHLLMVNRDHSR